MPPPTDLFSPNTLEHVWSVEELTRAIQSELEAAFPSVWVEGELFQFRRHQSGHLYMVLKDDRAQLRAVMWRSRAHALDFDPAPGMRVQCYGRITVYPPQGNYQIVVDAMRLAGLGDLLAKLEATKRRLAAEGLFDEARKKPLPLLPRAVGIVTSPTGAALRDMLRVIFDRFAAHVILYPAVVQGRDAAASIARGIEVLDRIPGVDVIVAGRGGGSLQDLWAFNEEVVVRAIAAATTPVVSAVGHEVDVLLSDLAADVRAPTPTAAGKLVVPDATEWRAWFEEMHHRALQAIRRRVQRAREALEHRARRLRHPRTQLDQHRLRLGDLAERLAQAARRRLARARERLAHRQRTLCAFTPRHRVQRGRQTLGALHEHLGVAIHRRLAEARTRLGALEGRLGALDPHAVLQRGYAIVRHAESGRIVRRAADAPAATPLAIVLAAGSLGARVVVSTDAPRPPPPAAWPDGKAQARPGVEPAEEPR